MKLEDMPTPESDELIATFLVDYSDGMTVACDSVVDQWDTMADKAISLERRLAISVAALKGLLADITEYQTINKLGGENNHWQRIARETIAQIEEGK